MSAPEIVIDETDVAAFKALAAGVASAGQQQRALRFLFTLTGIREMPRVIESPVEQGFDAGRRFVGWQVARAVELSGITTDLSTNKKDS